ncbi:hypothetical protein [Nostoc sp.]|uniref:hypothetical protein n=1 Tax=Nostoc sp. TaxID=1180 RepID=UPI002FFBEEF3
MAVLFCLLIQIVVYFLILSFIALIKKTTGKKINLKNYHFFALFLIIPSIAIYFILVAFLRGELEPINFNISYPLNKIPSLEDSFDNYKKTVKLSWDYDAISFILILVILWTITLFSLFKINSIKRDLTVKLAIFIGSVFMSFNVPIIVLDSKIDNKDNKDNNIPIPSEIQSKYLCDQALNPSDSYLFSAPIIGECRATQYYCNNLKGLEVYDKCKPNGW